MLSRTIDAQDTIFATASGMNRAAVCVLRLSGPQTGVVVDALCRSRPNPRTLKLRTLREPTTAVILDQAMVVWMPGPNTYTGEDMAELHLHGSPSVRKLVSRILSTQLECRHAEPGEFTRRAFLNGRISLSEAEATADLIDAETEAQRRQALRQLCGVFAKCVDQWRSTAIEILATGEALLDFPDEDDLFRSDLLATIGKRVAALKYDIGAILNDGGSGERVREGFVVVLAGQPNAGKSTLLNALVRRDVAIVSEIAGTTRDAIEVRCDFHGLPVTLVDTAGLRESDDYLESLGIERTRFHLQHADLIVMLHAIDETVSVTGFGWPRCLPVITKADLLNDCHRGQEWLKVSARTGQGLDALIAAICAQLESELTTEFVITRERHREALARAVASLSRVPVVLEENDMELVVEDLRLAVQALGEINGYVRIDEVLDQIFAEFCIGK